MTRIMTLFLLAMVITACGSASPPTPDRVATQAVVEEISHMTMTVEAPATNPPSTETNTPTPIATYTRPATRTATPTPRFTQTPIPTVATSTRSQDAMAMIYIAAGDFTMGNWLGMGSDDEAPPHLVNLDGYWIDRTEVTNSQYRTFVTATGYHTPTVCEDGNSTYDDEGKTNHPVVCVTWDDAQAYCAWAGGRLPTEAEWEKAARGLDERIYPWGDTFDGSLTNYCDASCERSHKDTASNDGYAETAPVGSYPESASPYGALDMSGNVWEWVSDWYNYFYYEKSPQLNPQGPNSGEYRVLRGGAWSGFYTNARTTSRAWMEPEMGDVAVGFRCVVPSTLTP